MSFLHRTKAQRTPDGYASKLESAVAWLLNMRQKMGEIKNLREQVTIKLTDAKIGCRIDFMFEDVKTGKTKCAEAKGLESDRWKIIKKLWPYYCDYELEIYKGNYKKPKLVEVITPIKKDAAIEREI